MTQIITQITRPLPAPSRYSMPHLNIFDKIDSFLKIYLPLWILGENRAIKIIQVAATEFEPTIT